MAATVEKVNELTFHVLADKARERLAAGSGDLLDAMLVDYQAATPEQRQAFIDCLLGEPSTEVDRCR